MDFCPYYGEWRTSEHVGDCRGLGSLPTFQDPDLNEEVGLDSKCIDGDFVLSGDPI